MNTENWFYVKDAIENNILPKSTARINIQYKSGQIGYNRPAWALTFSEYPIKFQILIKS